MAELNAIASDPDKDNVHMVADYSESLQAIRKTVATQVCPSNLEGNISSTSPSSYVPCTSETSKDDVYTI